jgi:hypothetical protein
MRVRSEVIRNGLLSGAGLILFIAGPTCAATLQETCAGLTSLKVSPVQIGLPTRGARVTDAQMVGPAASPAGAAPQHCQVKGAIDPMDPAAPPIRFVIDLPVAWNHKAMMFGGGGYDGVIPNVAGPLLAEPADQVLTPLLRGYATFASDSGHEAVPGAAPIPAVDAAFTTNDEALANYAGAALKKTRDTAVVLIRAAYGRDPEHTYFGGGSNGGREALLTAQRWPEDFDGVIAAFPFWNAGTTTLAFGAVMNGFAAPGAYLPPAGQALLFNAVMARCDGLDGLKDGLISNVEACHFDPATLKCAVGQTPESGACLSEAQITALRKYDARTSYRYRSVGGETSYPGFPVFAGADLRGAQQMSTTAPTSPAVATMPTIAHFWSQFARFAITRDPEFDALKLDPEHPARWTARINQVVDMLDASSTDLSRFKARGGKLIIYHGLADSIVSPRSTMAYWNRLRETMGAGPVRNFARFYLVPGYGHGPAGLGAFNPVWDPLTTLELWTEQGHAPGPLTISDGGASEPRSRPLCEYGAWPRYDGHGAPGLATSFSCVASASPSGNW